MFYGSPEFNEQYKDITLRLSKDVLELIPMSAKQKLGLENAIAYYFYRGLCSSLSYDMIENALMKFIDKPAEQEKKQSEKDIER
jgi:hypothetical protein